MRQRLQFTAHAGWYQLCCLLLGWGVVGVLPWVWVQAVRGFKGCTCSAVCCRCSAPLAAVHSCCAPSYSLCWSHVGWSCCGTEQRALCVGAFSLLTASELVRHSSTVSCHTAFTASVGNKCSAQPAVQSTSDTVWCVHLVHCCLTPLSYALHIGVLCVLECQVAACLHACLSVHC